MRGDRRFIPIATVILSLVLFAVDLVIPLGVADAMLYGAVVILSALSPQRRLPVLTAAGCTVLAVIGDEHLCAGPAVGRAPDADHRGQRGAPSRFSQPGKGFVDARCLLPVRHRVAGLHDPSVYRAGEPLTRAKPLTR